MQKFDHRILIYGFMRTQERVLVRQGKRAVGVRAIEVLLHLQDKMKRYKGEMDAGRRRNGEETLKIW